MADLTMRVDAKGRHVPEHLIKPVDLARDDLVRRLVAQALDQRETLRQFKAFAEGELDAFLSLSAEQYEVQLGGAKGNVSLLSYDGLLKITRQIQDRISFDERLQAAKKLIDECVLEWAKGSAGEIQILVQHAFQVDKEGQINAERVLSLRRLEIADERWQRAMRALTDSIQVDSTKAYLRFYERAHTEAPWQPISLDLAALEAP